jgi:iron complex outermembrane receptor protein
VSPVVNDPRNCTGANVGNPDFCATQFNTYLGGNSQLKPEKSQSLTLGFVAEPIRNFSVGVDYFKTEVKDMIQTLSLTYILQNEAVYQSRVQRGPSGEIIAIDQRLENVGKVNLAGWDFDLRWNFSAGDYGKVLLGWTGTYMSQWDSTNPDGSTTNNIGTTSGAILGYIPRFKHYTTATWLTGPWAFSGQYNWQSGGTDICGNLIQDDFGNCPAGTPAPTFGAYETFDVQVVYTGIKNLGLTLGVRNLFNHDPPYVNGSGGAFQAGYDPTYVDPRGRFAYFKVNYKFF